MSPFGQEMMYFNTSPSIHPITGCVGDLNQGADPGDEPQVHRIQVPTDQSTSVGQSWATGSITNVDKGQHCLVERVKLNISEICPFVTILAKGFLYKALTQKSFTHTASLEEQFSQRRMKTLTGGKNGVFTIAIVGKMPINVSCHVPITEERQETKNQLLLLASAAGTRTGLFYLQDDTFLVDTSAEVRLLPPNLF
ncbi:uncharacterized protein [Narcine bancroftii]|uniref:uncharacterized protein isoform X1 n=1 Tax=Narcine bancroftii TaxID=1343680 RepID=UPI003831FC23